MSEKKNEPKTTKRTLHYYWQELVKYKWYSLGAFLLTPIIVFVRAILAPLIFADLIEKVSQGMPFEQLLGAALTETVLFLALYLINKILFEELRLYLVWKMELMVIYDLSNKCFDTVSEQSMQFHNDRFSGSLVSQTNKFVWGFERLIDTFVWDILPMVSYLVMMVIVLAPKVFWFAIGLVVFVALYALIAGLSFRKIGPINDEEASMENKQTGQLADSITNIMSVKSYAMEDHERARYTKFAKNTFNTGTKLMRATIRRDTGFSCVQIGIMALILAFLLCGQAWFGISVATLVLIVDYSQTIQGELWSLTGIFKNLNRVFGDAHEMTMILDMPDDVVDAPNARPLLMELADINFEHISFQHAEAKTPIFEDFSLKIKPGERVGLVGVSGSGKTTLTKLLLRFADVQSGQIKVSNQNIKNVTQKSLRENIAYVPQETSLFHRSIAENIAYGKPDATAEEIQRAARLANAHDFILGLPEGYDTLVGERGIKLSGGQRQRIAIARAILKNAPILVLDEATSALDSESEALIQGALTELMRDRTSVVIAHRLSTVASLDRILVLEHGEIVEQGTHAELLQKPGGVYQKLWDRQSGAFAQDEED